MQSHCEAAGATCHTDKAGNLYAVKGTAETYPCAVAHLDQVQREHSYDFRVYEADGVLFGFSPTAKAMQGLGADDKNGIWVALELLREFDKMKAAFFVSEEVGCVGSSHADMKFFADCRFVLQADRRGSADLITEISGPTCSAEFLQDLPYKAFGYSEEHGLMTDILALQENGLGVSAVNFSCGYHHPHTDHETTVWSELINAREFAAATFRTCLKVYPHDFAYGGSWYNDYDFGYAADKHDYRWSGDEQTMRYLMLENPEADFEQIWSTYSDWFYSTKKKVRKHFNKLSTSLK